MQAQKIKDNEHKKMPSRFALRNNIILEFCADACTDRNFVRTDARTDRRTDAWMHGQMHEWVDGCMI